MDEVARRQGAAFDTAPADALVARLRLGAEPVLLAKPLTMMNLSGEAVGALARYYKLDIGDLLVVADDVNLPLGRLRARAAGRPGGTTGSSRSRSTSGATPTRGCAWAWAAVMRGETWPITCWRRLRRTSGR